MQQDGAQDVSPGEIGARARRIRRRRGLSLSTAAGLAGISPSYLSMLESGQRRFDRRSLINNVAEALGCSVLDLTAEPYGPSDRIAAEAISTIPAISMALLDCAIDDVPDIPARPIHELVDAVRTANAHRDQTDYVRAGQGLGLILTELQVVAATARDETDREKALCGLVEAGIVAYELTKNLGHPELGLQAARRSLEAARRLDHPALLAFAQWNRALALMRLGARRRAGNVLEEAIEDLEPVIDPDSSDTLSAEVYGLLHLTSALHAARSGAVESSQTHLDEAEHIAGRTGERNSLLQHFGPTNVAAWRLSIGVELEEGARAYERAASTNIKIESLQSRNRTAGVNFDLARALAQEGGSQDLRAIKYLDRADRTAPHRTRQDPVARELVATLNQRARKPMWELTSLRHRFGVQ